MVKSYEKQAKSKAEIAKEKSLVTKQNIKEKEEAPTTKEKKDLDATPKRKSGGGGIHAGKSGKDITISPPKKSPSLDSEKGGGAIHKGKPKKKPQKDYEGPIIKGIKEVITKKGKAKIAQAAEVGKGGKSPGPKERKKLSAVSGKEKAKIAKKKADAKAQATREEARKPKKKEAKKQAETGTRDTTYEARVKALVAKKASLSKKETADGRSEYQVQMNKLKKEDKKAWKKMFKGGKLKD